ncbi:MAG TPA: hypothetical protein VG013_27060 [Gemmataceae bacterium]|jgi:hypothetical protein|nr:hypothetical protein [Gemmataceae bacterium]
MRTGSLTLLLLGGLCALPVPAAPPAKPRSEDIHRLVSHLGSGRFSVRQAATRELDALGAAALDALHQAASDPDAEVRRRAVDLAAHIERRIETAQVLTPTRLRFVCKDKPVADAVAEFSRKTGFAVQIDPAARTRLGDRRVTLDTGDTTFWDAFEKLCDRAGLVEAAPKTIPQRVTEYDQRLRGALELDYGSSVRTVSGPVMLEAGKPERLPTFHAGAARIKVLSPRIPLLGHTRDEGESLFGLEVDHEPQLRWQGVVGLRILKAIDEHGLRLSQPNIYVGERTVPQDEVIKLVVMSERLYAAPVVARDARQVPVRLRLPGDRSKALRQLSGIVSAEVVTPPMPLITIPDVLKAAGRIFKDPDGHAIKVIGARRLAKDTLRLRVRLDTTNQHSAGMPGGIFIVRGGIVDADLPQPAGGPVGVALHEATGRALRLVKVQGQNVLPNPAGSSQEWTLIYRLPRNRAEGVKLVYTGPRTLVIDVPFTLRDVPLP